ncbi:MAG: Ig-like domain repeat protein [Candidatus Heimdallarchaeota archaeon]|nr:Ig-like domain repeat protein [Candidatus Heimdallarchaeota archaeon]
MPKPRNFLLILLLLFSLFFFTSSISYTLAADTTAPTIHEVFFNCSTAVPDDVVLISVNATDESSITLVSAFVCNPLGHYVFLDSLNFNSSTGYYEANFTVGQYWLSGDYYIGIVVAMDNIGNVRRDYHPGDFTSPIITISGTDIDSTPPELHSLVFDRADATAYETVLILANITDEESGVKGADARLVNPQDNTMMYVSLFLNVTSGFYVGTFEVNPYWIAGDYTIGYFVCMDNANNGLSGFPIDLFPKTHLNIYGTTGDGKPPTLNSIYFTSLYVHTEGSVKAYANVTDNLSGINYVYALLQDPQYSRTSNNPMFYDDLEGLFYQEFSVTEDMAEGIYFFEWIYLTDNANNVVTLEMNQDFISPLIAVIHPSSDLDMDGLPDDWENQNNLDSSNDQDGIEDNDQDGLVNNEEYLYNSDPWNNDTDGDGLEDGEEINLYNTDPTNLDTDGDGVSDGEEVEEGTDPLNENDYPANPPPEPTEPDEGSLVFIVIPLMLTFLGSVSIYKRKRNK